MADDGLGPIDVTGRWLGFYRYRSEQMGAFPITADIRQEGSRISGEMYDQITDQSEFLDTLIETRREDVSRLGRLNLEAMIRRFGDREIVVNSRLPDTSDLEGTITGDRVEFTKAYRGLYEVKWSIGGTEIGSREFEGHKVHYSGLLDREKRFIAGEWVIRWRGLLGPFLPPRARGTFELYQKS